MVPEDLVKGSIPATGLREPEKWRGLLYEWLQQYPKVDPTAPYIVNLGRSYTKYAIYSDGEGFAMSFGGSLKLRSDPINDWEYSRYETQSKLYLEQAPRSSLSVIYVASGDLSEVAKFATDAAGINMTVATKFDLLTSPELDELNALAWNQQALNGVFGHTEGG
ncbi:hypothetical protein IFR05_001656 [Cadophora sp. M221]|nr:hypothetical protein IFR05_001656 [Cadophora sp. M221]